jgi:DNA-binding IclR family transcriptional regulator
MNDLPAQPIQGIIDGTAALQELAASPRPLSCAELGAVLNLDRTRANRILMTLAGLGFARQVAGRKYVCGPAIHSLAAQSLFASGLLQAAYPFLRELESSGHIVALGVLWRDTVSYLYHGSSQTPDRVPLANMSLHPAETSSIGVALLAEKTDDEIRQLYAPKNLEQSYPDGLDGLLETIATTRRAGFTDLRAGTSTRSMAVPIGHPAIAALAVSGNIPAGKTIFFRDYLLQSAAAIRRSLELKGKIDKE